VRRLAASRFEEGPPVASHGAFRTDQLLVRSSEPVIIDLDSLCWANPARGVGNFFASLRWKAIREPHHAAFVDAAVSSFLEGYATLRPIPDERWLARYQAASMLKLAGRRFRKLNVNEWPLVPRLLDGAHALIRRSEHATRRAPPADAITGFFRGALDTGTMSARFRPLLGTAGTGVRPAAVTRVQLLCEKPEHRWTFFYTLEKGGQEVVGKVYREAGRRPRRFEAMKWL